MPTSIQSAGVPPEVNLRITQVGKYAKTGSTLALKPRADVTRSLKQGYQWPHEKDLCPLKMFLKKIYFVGLLHKFWPAKASRFPHIASDTCRSTDFTVDEKCLHFLHQCKFTM